MNKTTLNSQKEKHSMLSLRRATSCHLILWRWQFYFYPRSPCGERPVHGALVVLVTRISIHALLAESDQFAAFYDLLFVQFLSTLSLRRATADICKHRDRRFISIHALLAESDHNSGGAAAQGAVFLSTLSLRRATSAAASWFASRKYFYPRSPCGERLEELEGKNHVANFYPRSPCGERRAGPRIPLGGLEISIHALLAESDQPDFRNSRRLVISIHALLAESDCSASRYLSIPSYFYPRSPCGERRMLMGSRGTGL